MEICFSFLFFFWEIFNGTLRSQLWPSIPFLSFKNGLQCAPPPNTRNCLLITRFLFFLYQTFGYENVFSPSLHTLVHVFPTTDSLTRSFFTTSFSNRRFITIKFALHLIDREEGNGESSRLDLIYWWFSKILGRPKPRFIHSFCIFSPLKFQFTLTCCSPFILKFVFFYVYAPFVLVLFFLFFKMKKKRAISLVSGLTCGCDNETVTCSARELGKLVWLRRDWEKKENRKRWIGMCCVEAMARIRNETLSFEVDKDKTRVSECKSYALV